MDDVGYLTTESWGRTFGHFERNVDQLIDFKQVEV